LSFKLDKIQIIALFFIPVAILISINIVQYMNSQDTAKDQSQVIISIQYLEALETLRDYVNDAHFNRQLYLFNNEKESLALYYKSASLVDSQYSKIKKQFTTDENQKLYLDTVSTLIKLKFDVLNRSIELQKKKGSRVKYQKPLTDESESLQERLKGTILKMKNEELSKLSDTKELEKSKGSFTRIVAAGGSLVSIILFAIILFLSMKNSGQVSQKNGTHKLTADELETIVRERTAEISKINTRLYKEIEEHKKAEVALKESEKDLYNLFEQAHDAIIIFTPEDQKVLDVNNRACDVYGIEKKNFIGISMQVIFKNIPENVENIKKILANGYYYNFQTVHYKKDATEMLMEINASVINYKGQTAILSINRDITERILALIPLPGS
jgi:PAS domain S-box-containing protein